MFLRNYSENINLEIPDQVVILDETQVFANGSNIKIWSDGTSQSAIRGDQHQVQDILLLCMLEHEMDFFLGKV
jgi:hypothetical protein